MSTFFDVGTDRVELIMPQEQGKRLRGTCFRGKHCHQAGNLFAWSCFLKFLQDEEVRQLLTAEFTSLIAKGNVNRKHRLELKFSKDIGWDSVVSSMDLTPDDIGSCELREINARTKALFLPSGRILAPKTNLVTVVLRMTHDGYWKFIVGTIYPGSDCGELSFGNLTESRGLVWLPWSNPGEE